MPTTRKPAEPARDSLTVELGGWFKASATGRGVFVIGVILLFLGALGLAQAWLGGGIGP
ncbi:MULTISPECIES: hypothetical protein [Phenylobacterium]|uniref:Uncharacterized protein n=1 Tax=Phenylobacterium koreense TaxID=266125 RepID=A0ABV2ELU0_9CAUL